MSKIAFIVALALLLIGCHSGGSASSSTGGRSLAGNWSTSDSHTKAMLVLGQDQTFSMLASNDFAAGYLTGTFSESSDRLTLNITGPTDQMTMDYDVKWLGPDQIQTTDQRSMTSQVWTRSGVALKSATIDAITRDAGSLPGAFGVNRLQMESTACYSNLKQIGTAMMLYAQDYDSFPSSANWQQQLYPYVKSQSVFTCPTLAKQGKQGGYAMNDALSSASPKSIPTPAGTVLVFEAGEGVDSGSADSAILAAPRHATVGVLYADGHVKDQTR